MDFFSESGLHKFISFRLGNETNGMSGHPVQESLEETEDKAQQTEQILETEVAERPEDTRSITELSSTSDPESCGAYFTRKMDLSGAEDPLPAVNEEQVSGQDEASVSDTVSVTPGANFFSLTEPPTENRPVVFFLDSTAPVHTRSESRQRAGSE